MNYKMLKKKKLFRNSAMLNSTEHREQLVRSIDACVP